MYRLGSWSTFSLYGVSVDRTYLTPEPDISGLDQTYLTWSQTYPALQFWLFKIKWFLGVIAYSPPLGNFQYSQPNL
jgi:hypothetical protein